MFASLRATCCALGCAVAVSNAFPQQCSSQDKINDPFERGQKLFQQVFEPVRGGNKGDGLGPMFNERSCSGCHFLGGIGGAGPVEKNVELFTTAAVINRDKLSRERRRLVQLHPGFNNDTSIVLHRFGTDPNYADFREGLLGLNSNGVREMTHKERSFLPTVRRHVEGAVTTINAGGLTLLLTQRNTPSLFGLGLIDSISDAEIQEVASRQTQEDHNVTGRFTGRFGWRGQIDELNDFIRGACAVELGLQVSSRAQAIDPLAKDQRANTRDNLDLTDQQCDELTEFVSQLPAPRRIEPTNLQQTTYIKNGEDMFNTVGCALCHRPTLGKVSGIYSDLLLHDLGSELADPVSSPRDPKSIQLEPKPSRGYSGGGFDELPEPLAEAAERRREWKTPPLWGVRDSAPYLHDGRAKTIEAAIVQHGGEAADSADRYLSLPRDGRARLLAFLSTLAAPDPPNARRRMPENHPKAIAAKADLPGF